jgi:outer membrane biosynthesis protein TonB
MQATLLNFGDNTRVVCDTSNKPFEIGIGKIVEADLHDLHFNMIRQAVATDTLMVVPKETRMSEKLRAITTMLEAIETAPYDELLKSFLDMVPGDGDTQSFRPTRHQMRTALATLARVEVGKALGLASRVVIREEGDEVTRRQPDEIEKIIQQPEEPKPPVKEPEKDAAPRKKAKKAAAKKPVVKSAVKRERL